MVLVHIIELQEINNFFAWKINENEMLGNFSIVLMQWKTHNENATLIRNGAANLVKALTVYNFYLSALSFLSIFKEKFIAAD